MFWFGQLLLQIQVVTGHFILSSATTLFCLAVSCVSITVYGSNSNHFPARSRCCFLKDAPPVFPDELFWENLWCFSGVIPTTILVTLYDKFCILISISLWGLLCRMNTDFSVVIRSYDRLAQISTLGFGLLWRCTFVALVIEIRFFLPAQLMRANSFSQKMLSLQNCQSQTLLR